MAFFSGTDNEAIKQEAINCNHFLSLVVDTKGTYVARVTKRNVVKETIHQNIVTESCYPTYEDKLICSKEQTESTQDFVRETLEVIVYPLNIEVEKWETDNVAEWDQDIKEAQAASSAKSLPVTANEKFTQAVHQKPSIPAIPYNMNAITDEVPYNEKPLFSDKDFKDPDMPSVDLLSAKEIDEVINKMFNESDIKYLTLQILSGNPFVRKEHCNMLPQYAVKLPTVIRGRYSHDEDYFGYIDLFIENLMQEFASTKCIMSELEEDFISTVAMEIQDVLDSLPKNSYINHIGISLNGFML